MPEALTTKQAAQALNVSAKTIRKWIAEGRIRASQLPGGHWRIERKEVDRLLGRSPEEGRNGNGSGATALDPD